MATQDNTLTSSGAETVAPAPPDKERRVWLPFHVALGASLALLVFIFNAHTVWDPDIWWHLNDAERILHSGHLPSVDNFSWTAKGSPWMDHEWLAEIPFYLSYSRFGLRGLYGLSFLLSVVLLCLILYRSYRRTGDIKNSFPIAVFCVLLTVVSFGPRMLLFGWIYMLILLLALDRFRDGHQRALWILPPLFLLWINTHGSWMIGLVVWGLTVVGGCFEFQIGLVESHKWSPKQLKLLIASMLISMAALFVNPYGYRLVAYPFDMAFHQKLNIQHVEEWASVDFHNVRGKVVFIAVAAIFLSFLFSRKKILLSDLLLLILALYSGLTYVRFLFLLAILASPFLSARLRLFPEYNREIDKPWLNLAFLVVVLGIIAWRFPSEKKLMLDLDEHFPSQSISYLKQNGIRENVLTHYLWGGYIERFDPELPVFIDSRVDIFEYNGTLKDYLDLIGLKESLAILDRRKIDYVYFKPDEPLVYLLRHTGNWDVVHEDKVSILLRRKG